MNAPVNVHLLGRDYLLRIQGDPELVQEAAALVEEKVSGLPRSLSADTRDRYMLVMLNLAGEYLQEKRKNQALDAERQGYLGERVATDEQSNRIEAELIERIETALSQ